jgi:hypothetical protein
VLTVVAVRNPTFDQQYRELLNLTSTLGDSTTSSINDPLSLELNNEVTQVILKHSLRMKQRIKDCVDTELSRLYDLHHTRAIDYTNIAKQMMQETSRVKRQMSSLEKSNMVMKKVLDGKEEQITQMTGQIHELATRQNVLDNAILQANQILGAFNTQYGNGVSPVLSSNGDESPRLDARSLSSNLSTWIETCMRIMETQYGSGALEFEGEDGGGGSVLTEGADEGVDYASLAMVSFLAQLEPDIG